MTRMPSLLRKARRPALLASMLALVLCWPVLAGPPSGIEVTIVKPDGKSRSVMTDEADHDLGGIYRIEKPNGSVTNVDVAGGVSVYSLLAEAGVQTGYETIEIPRPGGGSVVLTRNAVEEEDPRPPGFFKDDATGKTMFIGFPPPGSRNVLAKDYFEVTTSAIRLTEIGKAEVSVDLTASRKEIEPGESVNFTAKASPQGSYRYDWTLEPGVSERDAGTKLTHRFEKEGMYTVVVGVYTSDDDGDSDSDGVTIQVGDPEKKDKPPREQDNDVPPPPPALPDVPSSDVAPYTPVPSTPTTPEPTQPDIATSGTPVEGNLLADVSDPPPSNILESARRAARDGNPQDDANDGDVGVSEAAVSIFAALALLGLGAGIETRQGRLPRLRLPRRSA
jgi:PKD domain-containing protein